MPTVKTKAKQTPPPQFVSIQKFNSFAQSTETALDRIASLLEAQATKPAETSLASSTPATVPPPAAEVAKAGPARFTTNPEWEDAAREIIGDALDHTEIEHTKSGGMRFTIVIKNEFSNADKEYLRVTKVDRRTKDVGAEGMDGVVQWAKLVKANLERPR